MASVLCESIKLTTTATGPDSLESPVTCRSAMMSRLRPRTGKPTQSTLVLPTSSRPHHNDRVQAGAVVVLVSVLVLLLLPLPRPGFAACRPRRRWPVSATMRPNDHRWVSIDPLSHEPYHLLPYTKRRHLNSRIRTAAAAASAPRSLNHGRRAPRIGRLRPSEKDDGEDVVKEEERIGPKAYVF